AFASGEFVRDQAEAALHAAMTPCGRKIGADDAYPTPALHEALLPAARDERPKRRVAIDVAIKEVENDRGLVDVGGGDHDVGVGLEHALREGYRGGVPGLP